MHLSTLLLIIALVIVGVATIWNNMNWETIDESNSTSEMGSATSKMAMLKHNGIRCRMKTVGPKWMKNSLQSTSMQTSVKILVKKKDVNKAFNLLRKMTAE